MDVADWLTPSAVTLRMGADSKRRALRTLSEVAGRAFGRPAGEVFDALIAREAEGSTGMGYGVALPHAPLPGLDGMRSVFVRLETPVAFQAVDEQPVDLMFALFAPEGAGSEHLRALARAARLLRDPGLRAQLRAARTTDAVRALLVQDASTSAA